MKKLLLSCVFSGLLAGISGAAVSNINLSITASEIQNNDGSSYSGVIRVGVDAGNLTSISATSTLSDALAEFTQIGSVSTNFPGFRSSTTIVADDTGNALGIAAGTQLYVIVGDAEDNFAVFTNAAWTLAAFTSPPTPPNQVSVSVGPTSVNVGDIATFSASGANANASLSYYQLGGAVPEPSFAMLGALGVLALLRRRR